MKLGLIIISSSLSNLFFLANHPISLVILIIAQSVILCVSIFFLMSLNWFAIMLFLIFMGGLMVLFIYIASLASNEMFLINLGNFLLFLSLSLLVSFAINLFQLHLSPNFLNFKVNVFLIFSQSFFTPTILSMLYLLLTLIITVNIIKLYEAPIRSII